MKKVLIVLLSIGMIACSSSTEQKTESSKLYIVTTTGMIADAAQHIAGNLATVKALMGPGVDPHLYKTSQGDLKELTNADLVFYNGIHLEGKMGEVLEKLAHTKPVVPISETIDSTRLIHLSESLLDPHVWFDVNLWSTGLRGIKESLIKALPEQQQQIEANYLSYLDELTGLDQWIKNALDTIPSEKRIMITSHDAFSYFGQAYDVQVKGLQGISTLAEYGLRDITNMVNYIIEQNIHAVFVESSVSQKSLNAVLEGCNAKGHELHIGGELFSDAMGAEGTKEGTYRGMIEHNVLTLVNALNKAND